MKRLTILSLVTALLACCVDAGSQWTNWDASGRDNLVGSGDTVPGLFSISILPHDTSVTQELNKPGRVVYKVMGTFVSGQRDLTAQASFSINDDGLGYFDGPTLELNGKLGGSTLVRAHVGSLGATTPLTVKIKVRAVTPGAPNDAASRFNKPCMAGSSITVAYPEAGTMVPPNLADLTVMWVDGASDLWEVSLQSKTTDVKLYTAQKKLRVSTSTWQAIASSNLAGSVRLSIRGVKQAAPAQCATSKQAEIVVGPTQIMGGIYYWTTVPDNAIMRYDFGQATNKPESYISQKKAGYCVGCHAISPDGSRLAFTDNVDDGYIMDVKNGTFLKKKTPKVFFQVFTPDNKYLVSNYKGRMSIRDGITGTKLAELALGGHWATHPELSPMGDLLVFTQLKHADPGLDFIEGSIATAPLKGTSAGSPTVIVKATGTQNNYYPAISPDGRWIIFNRSNSGSYSNNEAELWVVRTSGGAPVQLKRANKGKDLRNSWARWSPFTHDYKGGKLFWFSFSSIRDYGTELVNSNKQIEKSIPQIWMTAFAPDLAQGGKDPSFPAFWLPYQELKSRNHIAQWTKKVLKVK